MSAPRFIADVIDGEVHIAASCGHSVTHLVCVPERVDVGDFVLHFTGGNAVDSIRCKTGCSRVAPVERGRFIRRRSSSQCLAPPLGLCCWRARRRDASRPHALRTWWCCPHWWRSPCSNFRSRALHTSMGSIPASMFHSSSNLVMRVGLRMNSRRLGNLIRSPGPVTPK